MEIGKLKVFASLLFTLLWPATASAEPVTTFLASAAFAGMTWGQVILMVGMAVYGTAQQKKAEKKARSAEQAARDAHNAGLQDRVINSIATESPHTYVYGRARVGAAFVAMFNSGGKDEYKHLVCIHAAHECDAIEEIYINGEALGPLDADGNVTGGMFLKTSTEDAGTKSYNVTTGVVVMPHTPLNDGTGYFRVNIYDPDGIRGPADMPRAVVTGNELRAYDPLIPGYAPIFAATTRYNYSLATPMVRVRKHLGMPDDLADASLLAELPGKWLPTSVLRGYTYTVIRLNLNQAEFQGGVPQIEVLLRGKPLYDYRTGITAWSQNNALATYDYLTSEICGVPAEDLPLGQFITAANVCDEEEEFGPKYTFNGTVSSDQGQAAVLERMAQSMGGGIVSTSWDIYAGKFIAPVMALTQDGIVGSIAITPGVSDADLYNGVRGQYISEENNYVATDFKPYQNQVYVDADGRELWTNIDFVFTDEVQRVHNLCRIFTEDQRNGYTVRADFSLKAWKLKVGQRVTLSSTVFGWNEKIFRVTDKKSSPTSPVELILKEDDESIWDLADAVVPDSTPNTGLPNPFVIDKIRSVTCQSGSDQLIAQDGTIISRILAMWPAVTSQAVFTNGLIEVEWSMIDSDVWGKGTSTGDSTQIYLSPVEDNAFYTVRVRAVNPYLNVKSDWTYAAVHQVIGKTEPPDDVATFSISNGALSWTQVTALDMAGYVIRFHYARNASWADAAAMHNGLITSSPWRPTILPPGEITLMIKAIDTSGNMSNRPAVIYHNFGDTIVENLILTVDDKAAGFPGEKTNAAVEDGDLLADDSGDLFWGADNAQFWRPAGALFWPTQTFKQMKYVTRYVVKSDESGARLTLALGIEAASYAVEYRYGTQGSFWGDDDDFFWQDDAAPFWPPPTAWQMWPGAIEGIQEGLIEFRITTQAGVIRGAITELAIQLDVEDEFEEIDDVLISAAGTRLPITKTYRSIKNVQLTLQDDVGTAVSAKWNDKLATGPLIYCFDNAGNPVTGTIDARIQGVKG